MCARGKECALKDDGSPSCVCRKSCPDNWRPVCGSDGITYASHCEMHRSACIQNIKIKKANKGPCAGNM